MSSVRGHYTFPLSAMEPYDIDEMRTARRNKRDREGNAGSLSRLLTYRCNPTSCLNQKHNCIWSSGSFHLFEAFCGIMWVGVHGIDSICVVTRTKDLEQELALRMAMIKERKPEEPEALLRIFTYGLIGGVELCGRRITDIVHPLPEHRRFMEQIKEKPFGVVSVIPDSKSVCTLNGHKALSAKYDEEKAVQFLQNEMKSGVSFTPDKTVQTAISALDHLFRHEFKANEIQVFFWKDDGGQAKVLPRIREELDIEEHLAAIDEPDSCVHEEVDVEEHV